MSQGNTLFRVPIGAPSVGFAQANLDFDHEAVDCSDARLMRADYSSGGVYAFTVKPLNLLHPFQGGATVGYYATFPSAPHTVLATEVLAPGGPQCTPTTGPFCCSAIGSPQTPRIMCGGHH
jgi:hypothetical protein